MLGAVVRVCIYMCRLFLFLLDFILGSEHNLLHRNLLLKEGQK